MIANGTAKGMQMNLGTLGVSLPHTNLSELHVDAAKIVSGIIDYII